MTEKVDYEGLMSLCTQLIDSYNIECMAHVRSDFASISYQLNNSGLQSLATSVIDNEFNYLKSQIEAVNNYIHELIDWVSVNVIKDYQGADEQIKTYFEAAKSGQTSAVTSYGGYKSDEYVNETNMDSNFMNFQDNYGI